MPTSERPEKPRQFWPSMGALFAGLLSIVVLSLATDHLLRLVGIFPPASETMAGTALFLLALGHRLIFATLGSYLTALLAPRRPMRHAVELGIVGFVLNLGGLAAAWGRPEMGPLWYPIALSLSSIPCGWLGGWLHQRLGP